MKLFYSVSSIVVCVVLAVLPSLLPTTLIAQGSTVSFTTIPYSQPDLNRPGAGAEQWNDQNHTNIPINGTNTRRLDKYFRFSWSMLENGMNEYNWSRFDQEINDAISKGQQFSFGIMTHYPDAVAPHRLNYDGGYAVYPLYLHNMMQAEPVKDWRASNGAWVPNWNSEAYLTRMLALHKALDQHIKTSSYNGVAYKDVINYVDIRGYGAFGEWHSYTIADQMSQYPAGTRATTASLNRIIDAHVEGFPDFPLVIMVSAFDCNRLANTMNPPEVAYHALTRNNRWGKIGWRRDNWGATDQYIRNYTDQNTNVVNGMRMDTAIMNRWRYAPVVGEPCCNADYNDLENQVRRYHAVSFGNGNYSPSASIGENMRAASKAAGYRYIIANGTVPATVNTGTAFAVSLGWQNVGLTPTYEAWNIVYELKNGSGNVVWSSNSSFQLKFFAPEANPRTVTDNLTIPPTVQAGNYTLTVKVADPEGFRQPMPLFINDRNSDGSYTLRTITVSTGNAQPNQPPVANAGSNQTITLPTNSVQLNGSASSDPEGAIRGYRWEQVSGPSTATLSAAASVITTAGNLQQGSYVFRLTVTDAGGLTASATVTVTVNAASNQPPVANAGPDRNITLPASSTTLNGSGSNDPDGSIAAYAWAQVSGPAAATFSSTTSANITVSNLQQGTYVFRLTVRDNDGATDSDEVSVTVNAAANQPPVANAGPDRTVTLPANTANLNGSSSGDLDGTIASYAWSQVSGPSTANFSATNTANTTVSNLQQGTYVFRLTVRDDDGATDTDDVTVTVNAAANQPPVANAGPDRVVELPATSTTLNGSSSSDPDGTITSYLWQQVSGPTTATLSATNTANVTASNLQVGVYVFRLTVRDNNNATDTDEVVVTVQDNSSPNQPPVANAGPDRAITLPTNSTTLTGSGSTDSDGTIASYLWQQASGPSAATLSATNTANITVSNLQQGVYVFRLTVRDNDNAGSTDEVRVTVNPASNQPPVANAGPDRIITLPTSSAALTGISSSDPDGEITSYLWQQVSGPSNATLSSTTVPNISARDLQQGVYVFRLTVRDDDNASASDEVTVTVNPAPNQPPVANAGPDAALTLPTNSVNLSGSGSFDADGVISSYLWQQVSGPSNATFSATNTVSINVSNLQQGVYVFRMTVRDNDNATASDEVRVTVNPRPNQAPVANAGSNRVIVLPTNSTALSGAASTDPDGTIASYQWQQVSGPSTATFSATNTVNIVVSDLQQGVYVFRLTVRDNNNATGTATVQVTVNPRPNIAPTAVAGEDQVITSVSNSATLDGSASSDSDGTIVAFTWRQINGPGATQFSATNTAVVTISGLVVGEYEYELLVRDNRGAIARDTVVITVIDNFQGFGQTLALYPNPAQNQTNLRLLFEKDGVVRINIYDMKGSIAMPPVIAEKPVGAYTVNLDISKLMPGTYVVETIMVDGRKRLTTKLLKR